jgi:hypothetical protein
MAKRRELKMLCILVGLLTLSCQMLSSQPAEKTLDAVSMVNTITSPQPTHTQSAPVTPWLTDTPTPGDSRLDESLEALPLLSQSGLTYPGAFRVPDEDGNGHSLAYGGYALTYNPINHSLFFAGHDWDQLLCEISIPDIIDLDHSADILQDCVDVTEGRLSMIDDEYARLGGGLIYHDRFVYTTFSWFDSDGSQVLSHFATTTDLSKNGDLQGPYQVGDWAGIVSGYMALIPGEWQAALGGSALTGNCCLSIISRTSYGPAVAVYNPDDVGVQDPVPATPLLYYPQEYPLAEWDATNTAFNGSTQVAGVAFPAGTRSILFFGIQGMGDFCYGTGEECHDPTDDSKGTHAYPYAHQVWAYDALDLLKVKSGQFQPWEIQPYALWTLNDMNDDGSATIFGMAYDPESGNVFLTERYEEEPMVHVYQVHLP